MNYGDWFFAMYDGECDECGCMILEGDDIRSDGQGGYLCVTCGSEYE